MQTFENDLIITILHFYLQVFFIELNTKTNFKRNTFIVNAIF